MNVCGWRQSRMMPKSASAYRTHSHHLAGLQEKSHEPQCWQHADGGNTRCSSYAFLVFPPGPTISSFRCFVRTPSCYASKEVERLRANHKILSIMPSQITGSQPQGNFAGVFR